MVKPDPILLKGERSDSAVSSDKLQEQLAAQRQKVFGSTFWLVIAAEAAMWYFHAPVWLLIVVPVLWVGFIIHNNALLILHELWEVNDQLSGRKDEFGELIKREKNNGGESSSG